MREKTATFNSQPVKCPSPKQRWSKRSKFLSAAEFRKISQGWLIVEK
jgi:hypothetical protein